LFPLNEQQITALLALAGAIVVYLRFRVDVNKESLKTQTFVRESAQVERDARIQLEKDVAELRGQVRVLIEQNAVSDALVAKSERAIEYLRVDLASRDLTIATQSEAITAQTELITKLKQDRFETVERAEKAEKALAIALLKTDAA
jgi:hypothetical protein